MAVSAPLCNVPSFLSPWSPQLPKPSHPSLSFPHHLSSNSNSLLALSCAHSPTKTDALIPSPSAMNSLLPSPSTTTPTPTSSTIGAGIGFDWSSPLGCPSLAYANVLFFKSTYNVRLIVEENEPEGRLLNRFKREVARAGILQECRRRRFFENKHDKKKRKAREAAKRNRKRRRPMLKDNKNESSKFKTRDDDEDDNWELPERTLPY